MNYQESQVHRCPVCEGLGYWPPDDKPGSHKPCHGCDGKGWVVVWVTYENQLLGSTTIEPIFYPKKEEVG